MQDCSRTPLIKKIVIHALMTVLAVAAVAVGSLLQCWHGVTPFTPVVCTVVFLASVKVHQHVVDCFGPLCMIDVIVAASGTLFGMMIHQTLCRTGSTLWAGIVID